MMTVSTVKRRYFLRLGVSMGIYLLSLFTAEHLISAGKADGAFAWVLGLIPGLAVVGAFYAIGMLIIEQKDEFMRMLLVRQSLIATAFALSLATVWGFLENFALVPHIEAFWVAILWFFGFGLGGFINRMTHGSWGQCL